MGGNYGKMLYKDYEKLVNKYGKLEKEYKELKYLYKLREQDIARLKAANVAQAAKEKEQAAKIEALKKEVARLTSLHNMDANNSGISTAKTPIQKNKRVPNSRKTTGKHIGGQEGHAKHKLRAFEDQEITEHETHTLPVCPECGGELEQIADDVTRDELDYEVTVRKIRHHIPKCQCKECGKVTRAQIPENLTAENQYGSRTRALILALGNDGNMSMQKIGRTLSGLTDGEITPSDGYIAKQQRWASDRLASFVEELSKALVKLPLLYWDDTVVMINKRRGCLRFYGDERLAYYCAHEQKGKAGLDEDNILQLLPQSTYVMHDHNRVNYNGDYSFSNIECNVHLLRDLQKAYDNLRHEWCAELKKLLEGTNNDRNEAMARGERCFSPEKEEEFVIKFDRLLADGIEANLSEKPERYYVSEEKALLRRLLEYKDNYIAWVSNFDLPFSNNLSERALRGVKSKQKVAGQFQNVEMAKSYAHIRSYIETCHRNGINVIFALERLCMGKPLSLSEVLKKDADL